MVDVFVSYARQDSERVAPLIEQFEQRGWDVWWDRKLKTGPHFDDEIERMIDSARVVVVVWSRHAVASDWVKTEASTALDQGVLLPVSIDPVRPPLAFRRLQTVDLQPWVQARDSVPLDALLTDLAERLGGTETDDDFVGRVEELATLESAVGQAFGGTGRLCLVAGEPGIGKTRLLHQLVARIEPLAGAVVWGFSYEDAGLPPYFAWTNVLRECVDQLAPDTLDEVLGPWRGLLANVLPELGTAEGLREDHRDSVDGANQERMRLFVAISQFLFAVARTKPLAILFDNVHLLDDASLKLLQFVGEQVRSHAIAIIATYRDTDVDRKHPLMFSLGALFRQPTAVRLVLRGLGNEQVEDLCRRVAGRDLDPAHAAQIVDRAEGNPLFVTELVQIVAQASHIDERVPDRIREVIAERLRRLPHDADEVLGVAAVLGRRFRVAELVDVLEKYRREQVLMLLDGAQSAGFVDRLGGGSERYRFRHDLVRQCLYEEHGSARRVALHRDLANLLERRLDPSSDASIALLAHHFYEAGMSGDLDKAVYYTRLAGQRAGSVFAFGEAIVQYERALELLDLSTSVDMASRAELLLEKGSAEYAGGNTDGAYRTLVSASIGASRAEAWQTLANAVMKLNDVGCAMATQHRVCVPLHELALDRLPDSALRIRLQASLALALREAGRFEDGVAMAQASVEAARTLGDHATLRRVLLFSASAHEQFTTMALALEYAKEAYALVMAEGDLLERVEGTFGVMFLAAIVGEMDLVRALAPELANLVEQTNHFHYRYLHRGVLTATALLEGRWSDAIAASREQFALGQTSGAPGVDGLYAYQMFTVHWARGQLDRVAPMVRGMSAADDSVWQPGYALICAELDMADEARAAFEKAAKDDFATLPRVTDRALILALLAEVCVYLGDRDRAAQLVELLEPVFAENIGFVHATLIGSGARYAAKLEVLLGHHRRAGELFEAALAMNQRIGAAPWLAFTQYDYALALLQTKRPDMAKVRELLSAAAITAERLQLDGLGPRVGQAIQHLDDGAERLSHREADVLHLVAGGASNKEIADRLFVSPTTVATHMRNILRKTEAANRVEAVAIARKAGWLEQS